jgi:hypothetical protein
MNLCANRVQMKKGLKHLSSETLAGIGDFVEARTPDPLIKSQLLYQLSYKVIVEDSKCKAKIKK